MINVVFNISSAGCWQKAVYHEAHEGHEGKREVSRKGAKYAKEINSQGGPFPPSRQDSLSGDAHGAPCLMHFALRLFASARDLFLIFFVPFVSFVVENALQASSPTMDTGSWVPSIQSRICRGSWIMPSAPQASGRWVSSM
jgi:hypothetical protein